MRLACIATAATLSALASEHPARAAITILKADQTLVPNGSTTLSFNLDAGGYDIHLTQLYNPNHDTVYEVHGNAGEVINSLSIDINGPAAGSPVLVRVIGDAPGSISTVRSIIQTGSAETILSKV